MRVAIYVMAGHRRSSLCAQAMKHGVRAVGDVPEMICNDNYRGVEHDACVFYGFTHSLQKIMVDYRAAGRPAVYIDLGYWKREGDNGHHKVVVNGRHPTAYFQNRRHDAARARRLGINLLPWRAKGDHILLAGMAARAAVVAEHIKFESFERETIASLRAHSDRKIVYRPKPSCREAGAINGTIYSPPGQPLADVLANCHAVVTHHSNVAVEALVAGIPAFCWQGVAAPLSLQDCSRIETPITPDDRESWINAISYCQWTWPEMVEGLPWRHLKDEGLVS